MHGPKYSHFLTESVALKVEGDFWNVILSLSPAFSWFLLQGPSTVKHLDTHSSQIVCLNCVEASGI